MYAMQYSINLPADYDMGIIRDRVARTGAAMDGFPGLRFKAYLIRERVMGQPTNEYAPFYVWDDIDGMRRFLWGAGRLRRHRVLLRASPGPGLDRRRGGRGP